MKTKYFYRMISQASRENAELATERTAGVTLSPRKRVGELVLTWRRKRMVTRQTHFGTRGGELSLFQGQEVLDWLILVVEVKQRSKAAAHSGRGIDVTEMSDIRRRHSGCDSRCISAVVCISGSNHSTRRGSSDTTWEDRIMSIRLASYNDILSFFFFF